VEVIPAVNMATTYSERSTVVSAITISPRPTQALHRRWAGRGGAT
jgi:hypothetical protein